MFRDSNYTTLTSCGLTCFENTHVIRSIFWLKIMFPQVCRINVPVFKLNVKWSPGMFRDSNDTTLTSCRIACFENTNAKRSTYFGQKSWFPHVCRINVPVFKLGFKRTHGDVLRFQGHNPHLMRTRLLREHSCQTKHLFWPKNMNSPCVPDKRASI